MKPCKFPEQNTTLGNEQSPYRPLPCHRLRRDPHGRIIICIKMSFAERVKLLFTGKLWHTVTTYNMPMNQPHQYSADKPSHLIQLRNQLKDQKS